MICSLSDLRNKEVINVRTGIKIGYVDDLEIDTADSTVIAMIVYGRPRGFGIFGHDDDIVIKCRDIELVGEDTILVNLQESTVFTKSRSFSVENLLK
ncbi:MAG: YlmC/YmxH family sporulation protein [Oscillospiraceae bacterium]